MKKENQKNILRVKVGEQFGTPVYSPVPANEFMRVMLDQISKDGSMTIRDFGTFTIKRYQSRKHFNGFAGKVITTKPRNRLTFKQAKSLGDKLNEPKNRKKV